LVGRSFGISPEARSDRPRLNEPGFRVNFMKTRSQTAICVAGRHGGCASSSPQLSGGIQYFTSHAAQNVRDNSLIYSNVFEAARVANVGKVRLCKFERGYQFARTFPTPEDEIARIPASGLRRTDSPSCWRILLQSLRERLWDQVHGGAALNAYGPGEDPDPAYAHVIPQLARKCWTGQYPVEVYGDGNQTRCFTFVDDIAEAFAMCLNNPRSDNETFNVSSDEEVTIKTTAAKIWKILEYRNRCGSRNLHLFPRMSRNATPPFAMSKVNSDGPPRRTWTMD